jgi:hypothetical protein
LPSLIGKVSVAAKADKNNFAGRKKAHTEFQVMQHFLGVTQAIIYWSQSKF